MGDSTDGGTDAGKSASRGGVPWLTTILAVLAAAGTALGAWSSYQSARNKGAIDELTATILATQQFATGIHDARDVLTTDQHVKAMVELSRLYAMARTPQQKLVLIQVAQLSHQWQGLEAMATLIGNDDQLRDPKSEPDKRVMAAIDRIITKAQTEILAQATTAPAQPGKAAAEQNAKVTTPGRAPVTGSSANSAALARSADPPLTSSANSTIAASAALIAALPKTFQQRGWIFVGDAEGMAGAANAPDAVLIRGSTVTTARKVPKPKDTIVACHDVNLRDAPHGRLVTIVSTGTPMQVQQPEAGIRSAFGATSAWTHRPITARWSFVEIQTSGAGGAASGCG